MVDGLVISDLYVSYGEREVLQNVSLSCSCGEWTGIVGANGSGKSTLLRCVTGQHINRSGGITIGGFDLLRDAIRAKSCFGYAVDAHDLPSGLTGRQYLKLVGSVRGVVACQAVRRLIDAFGLSVVLDTLIAGYSFGTRQKLGIVGALLGLPKVLVFDESLNGLDPPSAWSFKKLLSELVMTGEHAVVMTTHSLATVFEWCDRSVIIAGGSISQSCDLGAARRDGRQLKDFEAEVMQSMLSSEPI
jgi:ABC-2 type transport system ATP-binding protein